MKAVSKTRGFTVHVCTRKGNLPTSGWTNKELFWRKTQEGEALYPNAMVQVPVEHLPNNPDDWEIKP